jgi:hypothetical protein
MMISKKLTRQGTHNAENNPHKGQKEGHCFQTDPKMILFSFLGQFSKLDHDVVGNDDEDRLRREWLMLCIVLPFGILF